MKRAITKILDLSPEEFDQTFVDELVNHQTPDYRDAVCKEHLYGYSTIEELTVEEVDNEIRTPAKEIFNLMNKKGATYVRFIFE